jgi:hypothetical protein
VSDRFPLDRAAEAFDTARRRLGHKVLIVAGSATSARIR